MYMCEQSYNDNFNFLLMYPFDINLKLEKIAMGIQSLGQSWWQQFFHEVLAVIVGALLGYFFSYYLYKKQNRDTVKKESKKEHERRFSEVLYTLTSFIDTIETILLFKMDFLNEYSKKSNIAREMLNEEKYEEVCSILKSESNMLLKVWQKIILYEMPMHQSIGFIAEKHPKYLMGINKIRTCG